MSVDLRSLVAQTLEQTDVADPGAVARLVLDRMSDVERAEALEVTLRGFVRQLMSEQRRTPPAAPPASMPRSWKVQAVRDGWQQRLRDRVHVGDSQWKLLADCGYADLMAAADERAAIADRNAAWARTYREWARLLDEQGAATFADLPAVVQANALGAAA